MLSAAEVKERRKLDIKDLTSKDGVLATQFQLHRTSIKTKMSILIKDKLDLFDMTNRERERERERERPRFR